MKYQVNSKEIKEYVEEVISRSIQCASARGYHLIYKPDTQSYHVTSNSHKDLYIGNLEDAVDSFNQFVGE